MSLTSKITDYNPEWPSQYEIEAQKLVSVFASALLAIHHVGSTAVPGLSAKPEIDVLAVVTDLNAAPAWTNALGGMGYRRGGDLSEGHLFYKRDLQGIRTHKLHVCLQGHCKIDEMLVFRDHLRESPETRQAYQALKLRLERENTQGIAEYLRGKAPYIQQVLRGLR